MTVRSHYHDDLRALEERMLEMAEIDRQQITEAVDALATGDADRAHAVIERDKEIDDIYLDVEQRWHEIMAMQSPIAGELRLMSLILHTNHSLERIGDQAANIARIVEVTSGLPTHPTIVAHIREMASIVGPMISTAMEALTRRDLDLALTLPDMDEPADRLNRNMWREVAACADDPQLLEWAVRMMLVSRALERVGDRAVDVAEQVAFLLTGVFREFPEGWALPDGDD